MKRIIALIYLAIVFSVTSYSQATITLNTHYPLDGGTETACQLIRLDTGFVFKATNASSLTLKVDPGTCDPYAGNNSSATLTQNYIQSKTYMVDNGSRYMESIQYFDNLGRPIEVIQRAISPNTADLVSYQEYDSFGRKGRLWLPAVAVGNNGAYMSLADYKLKSMATYNSTAYNTTSDSIPYSKTVYESSPLNRVLEQYDPGMGWHKLGKAVKIQNLTNNGTSGALSCALFMVSGYGISTAVQNVGFYANNQLYVTKLIDENSNISYEFKNKKGNVILARQILDGANLDTYYVYDDFGNLCYVLPPILSETLITGSGPWNETNSVPIKQYAYLYRYDERNRCVWKKLPGVEPVYCVYDSADQLIFSQDGKQRLKKTGDKFEWTFYTYDLLGRFAISGIYRTNETQKELVKEYGWKKIQNRAGQVGLWGYSWYEFCGATPQDEFFMNDVLLVNYYDNHDPSIPLLSSMMNGFLDYQNFKNKNKDGYIPKDIPKDFKTELAYNDENGYGTKCSDQQGLLTGKYTKTINSEGNVEGQTATAIYYDDKGRVIQTKSINHLEGIDSEYIAYDFIDNPIKKKLVHTAKDKTSQTEIYEYTYDHAGRLLTTTHQLNGGTTITLARNEYDELGRLKSSQKHTNTNIKTSYAYNIRSWIKSISSPLFSQTLYYDDKVSTHNYSDYQPQYNGNISGMEWQVYGESTKRSNRFKYDALSRLIHSAYNGVISGGSFNTSYVYDKHGNITQKFLNGLKTANTYTQIEALQMSYNGNQLINVHNADTGSDLAGTEYFQDFSKDATKAKVEYTYNENGAMTKDLNKGITEIRYNSLNLPSLMDIKSPLGEARNEYMYSVTGAKLQVIQRYNSSYNNSPVIGSEVNASALDKAKTIDYVSNKIYENGLLKRILVDGGYYDISTKKYHFYLTDHLGNNRIVANQDGLVLQKTHYYPFGSAYAEGTGLDLQPYKYNGKELDKMHGLNMYDYSARHMDPIIGRFPTVDPMSEKYYSLSPYAYCANNPLKYIDPTGMALERPDDIIIDFEKKTVDFFVTEENSGVDRIYRRENGKITNELGQIPTGTFNFLHYKDEGYDVREMRAAGFMITDLGLSIFGGEVAIVKLFGWVGKGIQALRGVNAAKNTVVTTGVLSKAASGFKKLLTPVDEFDAAITIYRGTTGSEVTSSLLFATENATVAASYVKNGGQVVSYRISQFGLKSLEASGQLTYKTGMHGPVGTVSKEYVFKGKELIEYLNTIAAPLK